MFKELIKSFAKAKQTKEYELTAHDLKLQDIWNDLNPELKDFANETRSLGLGHNLNVRFNERGMAELVYQLSEIGYEIKKKEDAQ